MKNQNQSLTSGLIGKLFVPEARGPDAFDCYGLVMEIFRRQGKELPDYGNGILEDQLAIIQGAVDSARAQWKKRKKPARGLLVVLRFPDPAWASHIGVMLDDNRFAHTRTKTGVTIDRISSPAWHRRIEGFYEYVG